MLGFRFGIFLSGLLIFSLSYAAHHMLVRAEALPFMVGTMTLGGAFWICLFFSFKMPFQAMIGAGVLALLGFARGIMNLDDVAKTLIGLGERGGAPFLEFAVMMICLSTMLGVIRKITLDRKKKLHHQMK